jgi:hypothetical protein
MTACGGGGGGGGGGNAPPPPPPPPVTYTIGGSVTGLAGGTGLVLQVNGGSDLPIAADGAFTFATDFDNSSTYEVTVLTEPTATPAIDCAVNDGIGRIAGVSVNNVRVICSPIVDLYSANAEVTAIALSEDGSTLYLGGEFTNVGPPTATFVAIDGNSGQVTGSPGGLFGRQTRVAEPDGNGGWYVGGYYDDSGASPDSLLHVLPDGSINPNWNPEPDGTVTEIAVSGSTVYVAGTFSNIGGQSRRYLAALDATTGQATAWDPDPSGDVEALLVSGSTLYAGGRFGNVVSSQTRVLRRGIAAFDIPSGELTAWDPNVIGWVQSIALLGDTVYVGGIISSVGGFLSEGGVSRQGLAALDADTGEPTSWAPAVDPFTPYSGWDSTVREIIIDGNTVYVAGDFVEVEGQTRNALAALDATTGALTSWNPDVSGHVQSAALSGGTIYVTGWFDAIGGQPRDYLGAADITTGQVTAWNPRANERGFFIAASGGTVYAGGAFTSVNTSSRDRLAAIDTATGALTAWNPGTDGHVKTIAVAGNSVYVGGDFTTAGGQPRGRLASIDAATGLVNPWAPDADAEVLGIAVDGSTVYVGGLFRNINGQARNRIAAIDATSGLVTGWDPDANSYVYALAVSGTTVYVGGEFSNAGGQPRQSVAALDSVTGQATSWDPGLMTFVYDIEVVGNTVYLGTDISNWNGSGPVSVYAVDASTGAASGLCPCAANSISVSGNTLYYGGFLTLGGFNVITGTRTPFDVTLNAMVESIVATESVVYAAGNYSRVPGRPGGRIAAFPR